MKTIGTVSALSGLIVDVLITDATMPPMHTMLKTPDDDEATLMIVSYSAKNIARCLNISGDTKIHRGTEIQSSGRVLHVPVGKEIMGHVFDALGKPLDVEMSFAKAKQLEVYGKEQPVKKYQLPHFEIVETGIKVIDFFTPFVKGRKIGIIGGAGVGKTVLTTELMHNVGHNKNSLTMFAGIGERVREGFELYNTLKTQKLLDQTIMFMGQMNENASMRALVGMTAAEVACYYRDEEKKDVIFFVDNIYRHIQANNELSTMMGELPSEGGYQPSMYSDLKRFQDKLDSNENGAITSIQSIFIPADDLTDPAVVEIQQQLDAVIVLSRKVFEAGIFPAVDIINTNSSLLNEEVVGERHYLLSTRVKALMQKYESLKGIISIIGDAELSIADRNDYFVAQELIKYFTQPMFVTEELNGIPGVMVPREEMLNGVAQILDTPAVQ